MSEHRNQLDGCKVLRPQDDSGPPHPTKPKERGSRRKTADRFKVLNTFVDFGLVGLKRNELAVWLVLYRDSRDGIARTGQTDIAKRAGASRRTVVRTLSKLESRGLIQIVRRGGLNRGVSAYRVLPGKPPDV
jgi:hypothetical protein